MSTPQPPAHGSLLIVDDEEKILKGLTKALRGEGHEVIAASDPREARRLLANRDFDLVIVDNRMPELSGLDLIRELSAAEERPQIRVGGALSSKTFVEFNCDGLVVVLREPEILPDLIVERLPVHEVHRDPRVISAASLLPAAPAAAPSIGTRGR